LDSMSGKRSLKSVDGSGKDFVAGEAKHNELLNWEVITDRNVLENRVICLLYSSGTTGVPKGRSFLFGSSQSSMAYMECTTKQTTIRRQPHQLEYRLRRTDPGVYATRMDGRPAKERRQFPVWLPNHCSPPCRSYRRLPRLLRQPSNRWRPRLLDAEIRLRQVP